jgi:hypothetical protein
LKCVRSHTAKSYPKPTNAKIKQHQPSKIMKTAHLFSSTLATLSFFCTASASVIFQADFDGSGGGTGGPSDMVTSGGTGTLRGGNGTTATIETGPELGSGGGDFLRVSRAAATDAGGVRGAEFVPLSYSSNYFNAWYTNDGVTDSLVGAVDFFYRQNNDFQDNNSFSLTLAQASNANGLRVNLSTSNSNTLTLEVRQRIGALNQVLSSESTTFTIAADTAYHFAMLADGTPGNTVFKVFMETGTGSINPSTATPLIETSAFAIDGINGLTDSFLETGNFGVTANAWDAYEDAIELDFDSLRIYDSVPTEFAAIAIPEPGTTGVWLSALALLAVAGRRARRVAK